MTTPDWMKEEEEHTSVQLSKWSLLMLCDTNYTVDEGF